MSCRCGAVSFMRRLVDQVTLYVNYAIVYLCAV